MLDYVVLPAGFTQDNITCIEFTAVDNNRLDDGNTITIKIVDADSGIEISSDCFTNVRVMDDESK